MTAAPSFDQSAWLTSLLESNAVALAFIDVETEQIIQSNEAFTALMGSSDAWRDALHGQRTVEAEVTRAEGGAGAVRISVVLNASQPARAMVVVADVTAGWAAQHALETARAVLEARTDELNGVINRATATAEKLQLSELHRGRVETILEEQQQAVTTLAARLATAYRELEAFSYSVSHDLRTPLRSIDGFTKAILDHYGHTLDERAQDYLSRVRNATKRMSRLIDDLLKLARISKSTLRRQSVDLAVEARAVIEGLRASTPQRDVTFHAPESLVVEGDQNLLRIVLDNLLGNAWKFTARNPAAVISLGRRDSDGAIYVRDNGAGFDMRYADSLFGPFQRLHTTAEFEGTGIGLATVERVIAMHGGRISAEAAVNEGATFHFFLGASTRPDDNHHLKGEHAA